MVVFYGRIGKTEFGKRKTPRLGYVSKTSIGQIIKTPVIKASTEYLILNEEGFGTLSRLMDVDAIYIAQVLVGGIIKNPDLGISTIGIGYQPELNEANDKRIRRWPRDWHGDNMIN